MVSNISTSSSILPLAVLRPAAMAGTMNPGEANLPLCRFHAKNFPSFRMPGEGSSRWIRADLQATAAKEPAIDPIPASRIDP
jgi:hypothetical protein